MSSKVLCCIDSLTIFCYYILNVNSGVNLFLIIHGGILMFQMHGFAERLSQSLRAEKHPDDEQPKVREPESRWKGVIFIAGTIIFLAMCIGVPFFL